MKVSLDMLIYRLSKKFSVDIASVPQGDIFLERPVFYVEGMALTHQAVLISREQLDVLNHDLIRNEKVLFMCTDGTPDKPCCGALMTFCQDVLPAVIFNYLQKLFDQFDKWDEAIKSICYEGGSFQDLIDSCDMILEEPMTIVDKNFRYIAFSKRSIEMGMGAYIDDDNNITADIVNEFVSDHRFADLYNVRSAFSYTYSLGIGHAVNMFNQGTYVGRIIIQLSQSSDIIKRFCLAVLNHLVLYAEKLYNNYQSFNKFEIRLNSIRNFLLDGLTRKYVSEEQWEKIALENGWHQGDELQLIQLTPSPRYDKNLYAEYLGSEIERLWRGCICLEFSNQLLMLVNRDKFSAPDGKGLNQTLAYFLRDSLLIAGMSRPFTEIKHLFSAYEQTKISLDLGARLEPSRWYFKFDDYVLDYMLHSCRGPVDPELICSEKLLKLKKIDAERNTEYYQTLLVYINCRLNAAATAKKLFIQRSTFLYRMERIRELVGLNLDSDNDLLYLMLSFRILEDQKSHSIK